MKLKTHSLVTLIKVFNTNYEVIVNYYSSCTVYIYFKAM